MEHPHAHLAANSSSWSPGSACGLGLLPVVYYSLLLCLGLPGEGVPGEGIPGEGVPGEGGGALRARALPWTKAVHLLCAASGPSEKV